MGGGISGSFIGQLLISTFLYPRDACYKAMGWIVGAEPQDVQQNMGMYGRRTTPIGWRVEVEFAPQTGGFNGEYHQRTISEGQRPPMGFGPTPDQDYVDVWFQKADGSAIIYGLDLGEDF